MKNFDTSFTPAVIATTANFSVSLNLVPQGAEDSERVGRRLLIKSINVRGVARLPETDTTGDGADILRYWLIHDKQANGAIPIAGDIMSFVDFNGFNNKDNSLRFRTLATGMVPLNASAGFGNGTTNQWGERLQPFTIYRKVSIPIEFSGTSGAITTIKSNNLFMFFISQTGLITVEFRCRIRYTG